jgi:hypothetical protein
MYSNCHLVLNLLAIYPAPKRRISYRKGRLTEPSFNFLQGEGQVYLPNLGKCQAALLGLSSSNQRHLVDTLRRHQRRTQSNSPKQRNGISPRAKPPAYRPTLISGGTALNQASSSTFILPTTSSFEFKSPNNAPLAIRLTKDTMPHKDSAPLSSDSLSFLSAFAFGGYSSKQSPLANRPKDDSIGENVTNSAVKSTPTQPTGQPKVPESEPSKGTDKNVKSFPSLKTGCNLHKIAQEFPFKEWYVYILRYLNISKRNIKVAKKL